MLWCLQKVQLYGYRQEFLKVHVLLTYVIFLLVRRKSHFFQEMKCAVIFEIDEQNCSLKFASWTYDSARIDLTQKTNVGDLSNFMANSGRSDNNLTRKKKPFRYLNNQKYFLLR